MVFNFYKYLKDFEEQVISVGVQHEVMGQMERISVRDGKLASHKFGVVMHSVPLASDLAFVVDYYGLMKKSAGFSAQLEEAQRFFRGKQIKSLQALVVHFAAIRLEVIAELAPTLVIDFPVFKQTVLTVRGFSKERMQ